jgi:tight adherence protein B
MDMNILIAGGAGLFILVVLAVLIISSRSGSDDDLLKQLERDTSADLDDDLFQDLGPEDLEHEIEPKREGNPVLNAVNDILKDRSFGQKWGPKLARADLKLKVAEFALIRIGSVFAFFFAGFIVLFPGDVIFSLVAAFIGFFAPGIYVGRTISKRLHAFEDQLPDTLGLWVNALRSGYSVLQSMEAIARDAPEPTKTEFLRVVKEVQLGIGLPEALEHLLERVESEDLDLVVTAVNIQMEVGGNLAQILDVITGTIRERIKLKGEIRVLTSQGRITGYLIGFMPIALALLLNVISPGYMGPMFTNKMCGWPMLGGALALIGAGTAVIQKIVDIEI